MRGLAAIRLVSWCLPVVVSLLLLASTAVFAEETVYTVECDDKTCYVDKATYIGWRTYHSNCHVCHAQDAVGSTFAPSLVDRLKEIDKERFIESVTNGYTGQIGVMPGWGPNPNVNKHFDELYAYLKARSDGVLKPGKPKKKK